LRLIFITYEANLVSGSARCHLGIRLAHDNRIAGGALARLPY
jgi:hypothetical protein